MSPVAQGLLVDDQSPLLEATGREREEEPRGQLVEPEGGLNVQALEELGPELGLASHKTSKSSTRVGRG